MNLTPIELEIIEQNHDLLESGQVYELLKKSTKVTDYRYGQVAKIILGSMVVEKSIPVYLLVNPFYIFISCTNNDEGALGYLVSFSDGGWNEELYQALLKKGDKAIKELCLSEYDKEGSSFKNFLKLDKEIFGTLINRATVVVEVSR